MGFNIVVPGVFIAMIIAFIAGMSYASWKVARTVILILLASIIVTACLYIAYGDPARKCMDEIEEILRIRRPAPPKAPQAYPAHKAGFSYESI
jgi:hypothetical protein